MPVLIHHICTCLCIWNTCSPRLGCAC